MSDPIPDQRLLYGRASETAALRECYLTLLNQHTNKSRLVVVSGVKGVGKRSLVKSLLPQVNSTHGVYLTSSFLSTVSDKSTGKAKSLRPCGAFCEALNDVVSAVDDKTQAAIASELYRQFSSQYDREILFELLESTKPWLLQEKPPSSVSPNGSNSPSPTPLFSQWVSILKVQQATLRQFVRTVSLYVPLVLHLEQLENASAASIELLASLLKDDVDFQTSKGLLLVVSYTDASSLPQAAQSLLAEDTNSQCRYTVQLDNLSWDDVYTWTVNRFGRMEYNEVTLHTVADVVFERTSGNARLVQYALCSMSCTSELQGINEVTLTRCQSQEITTEATLFTHILDNTSSMRMVVELVAALKECGANIVDCQLLDRVLQCSCVDTVLEAQMNGLLEIVHGRIDFPSVELQAVAYNLISPSRRAAYHLRIGRKLWKHSTISGEEEVSPETMKMYDMVVRNLHYGVGLVTDVTELNIMVVINVKAGKHSMKTSSFPAAALYFENAITILGDRVWQDDCYEVSLMLYNCTSEAYYCLVDYDNMNRRLDGIFHNARTFHDKLQAYTTQVYAIGSQSQLDESLNIALEVLRKLGVIIPANPSKPKSC